ncbi:MAG: hypothetical protein O7E53_02360 [Alphaproteobacteria bacterium]|nr:hypothetical protein [Alphaproteobacteria bacterium]
MQKSVISKAEAQFAALQKKTKQALSEKETAEREKMEKVARLRALRLAKEAADKEAAAAKPKTKPKIQEARVATATLEAGAATGKVVEDDPLEIPPFLRREAN